MVKYIYDIIFGVNMGVELECTVFFYLYNVGAQI